MNYSFDKLLTMVDKPFFSITVFSSGEQYHAIEHMTDTVAHGLEPLVALERLLLSLKINEGRDLIPDAEQLDLPID